MDNLGDILYIIILAVIGITSVLGSGKRKKNRRPMPVESDYEPASERQPEAKPRTFWEMLGEEFDMETSQQTPPPVSPVPPAVTRPQARPAVPSPAAYLSEGQRSISPANTPSYATSKEPDAYDPLLLEEAFSNTEELKKAIIYSEILNRKY